jgi:uncharacterized SAM-binding protein YcdF (DUF218 family)
VAARARGLHAAILLACAATVAVALVNAGNVLVVEDPVASPDAIIMLASHEWERLPAAARLARANPHAVVLLTVPVRVTAYNCHRCGERVEWLTKSGVSVERILVLGDKAWNTHSEAAAALAYARVHRIGSLVIVTSPYHGRRALATFRTAFRDTPVRIGLVHAPYATGSRPERWWMNAYDRWYVSYEWAGLIWYAVRFQVNPFVS